MSNTTDSGLIGNKLKRKPLATGRGMRSLSEVCGRLDDWWPFLLLFALLTACFISGCDSETMKTSEINVELTVSPDPPQTGPAEVVVKLTDPSDQPVTGATIKLEGNMNHAGMKPSFSTLQESGQGTYEGKLEFTMGGDWFVLVNAELPDGSKVEKQIDVPGVAAK